MTDAQVQGARVPEGRILSINASGTKPVTFKGKTVQTGIFKQKVLGAVTIGRDGIGDDVQADLRCHGGVHKAIYVFGQASFAHWQNHLGRELSPGIFGENLTVEGFSEDEVRIGDLLICGDLVLQVSEPRISCWKLSMTLGEDPGFSKIFLEDGRVGFYTRVLEPGTVSRGDRISLRPAPSPSPTVREFVRTAYDPNASLDALKSARNAVDLSEDWRGLIAKRASALTLARQGKAWRGFKRFVVKRRDEECDGIASFNLAPADGGALPGYLPGQHIVIGATIPGHGMVTRNYSLSASRPGLDALRLTVKRAATSETSALGRPVSMSNFLHDCVKAGDSIEVKAPAGGFFIDQTDEAPLLLLAAGVGITPLYAMFENAAHLGAPAKLLFAARGEPERCFRRAIEDLCAAYANVSAIFLSDEPVDPAHAHNTRQGRITRAIIDELEPGNSSIFLCGPAGFMTTAEALLKAAAVAEDRIHIETFGAAPTSLGQPGKNYHIDSDAEYKVVFQRSGIETVWKADQGTLLDLAEASGLRPPFACRAGTCQSCTTKVHSGSFEYLELVDPMSPDETFICCTIPTSDVVLDL